MAQAMITRAEQQERDIQELNDLQERVVQAMEIASSVLEGLSGLESLDQSVLQKQCAQFLKLMKDVHQGLISKAHRITHYHPYGRDCKALRKEVELLSLKLHLLQEQAKLQEGADQPPLKEHGREPDMPL